MIFQFIETAEIVLIDYWGSKLYSIESVETRYRFYDMHLYHKYLHYEYRRVIEDEQLRFGSKYKQDIILKSIYELKIV